MMCSLKKLNKLDGVKQVIKEEKQILIISSVGSGVLDRAYILQGLWRSTFC